MSEPVVFTRSFAQLVWLLVHRPEATNEQKQALRSAVLEGRGHGFALSLSVLNRTVSAAGELTPLPPELPWMGELAARMAAHSVGELEFERGATASDMLGVARALASRAAPTDEGAHFYALIAELKLTTISARLGRTGFVRRATPMASPTVIAPAVAHVRAHAPYEPVTAGDTSFDHSAKTSDMHVRGDEPPPLLRAVESEDDGASARVASFATMDLRAFDAALDGAPGDGDGAAGWDGGPEGSDARRVEVGATRTLADSEFSRSGRPRALDVLARELDGELSDRDLARILDELTHLAEGFARDGRWEGVSDVLLLMIDREQGLTDADQKRLFLINIRRICRPVTLRGVAAHLIQQRDQREQIERIFVRAGQVGADVLLERLVTSSVASERRAYRSAIVRCPDAAPGLLELLSDSRWYVVRNAAELLGELGAREGDAALVPVLRHSDARVRRAAVGALARLGTVRGIFALQPLLSDPNATVRLQVAHALAAARLPRSVTALSEALDGERDPDVQHALLSALGSLATSEAVQRLADAARPGTMLSRKPTPFRLAAIGALGEAATPAAMATLRSLDADRDRDIRVAVVRALAAHGELEPAGR